MNYRIIEGTAQISVEEATELLKTTYWAGNRPAEKIRKSMQHSVCYGIRSETNEKLIGFARVITDYATTYYLCDVVIDPEYRHRGLGKMLIAHITAQPEYEGLRGFLMTRDAHGLYAQYGFVPVQGRAMERAPQN